MWEGKYKSGYETLFVSNITDMNYVGSRVIFYEQ